MRAVLKLIKDFFRKGDMVLLLLCLVASTYGCVIMASVTNAPKFGGSIRYILIQILATLMGVVAYAIVSSIDVSFFSEHRFWLIVLNIFIILLLIPFGTDNGTGNRSWIDFPFLPIDIQAAEICKIGFILVLASVMASHQARLSSPRSVIHMVFHLILLFGLNMAISRDAGVSLFFVAIFAGMTFAGGVSMLWYLLAGGLAAVVGPYYWTNIMTTRQRNRILILFDPTIDPQGINERYHSRQSLLSLTGGGLTGQGLFNGNRTQSGSLFAQHTDYIFSSVGEELGYIGCFFIMVLLFAIIARCIWVGRKTPDYMRKLICFGTAASLIFQVVVNIGMCIGVMPVIGITLPLFSYGGSSILTTYAMLGLVSGIHARPSPASHELYIRPPQ